MSEEKKDEKYNVKEELKDEGKFFGKRLLAGGIDGLGKLGRGVIGVFRDHPGVEKLEEDVEKHTKELKKSEAEK